MDFLKPLKSKVVQNKMKSFFKLKWPIIIFHKIHYKSQFIRHKS